jgi:hypothetical protein
MTNIVGKAAWIGGADFMLVHSKHPHILKDVDTLQGAEVRVCYLQLELGDRLLAFAAFLLTTVWQCLR